MNDKSKEQANFQDDYKNSSNFGKKDTANNLQPDGDGTLSPLSDNDLTLEEIRKAVNDVLDGAEEE